MPKRGLLSVPKDFQQNTGNESQSLSQKV